MSNDWLGFRALAMPYAHWIEHNFRLEINIEIKNRHHIISKVNTTFISKLNVFFYVQRKINHQFHFLQWNRFDTVYCEALLRCSWFDFRFRVLLSFFNHHKLPLGNILTTQAHAMQFNLISTVSLATNRWNTEFL